MGSSLSKPEFCTVLPNKQVPHGGTIVLCCEANTENVTATWEKDDQVLKCVMDKHFVTKNTSMFSLKIVNADESDEGKYTIKLKNRKGEISCFSYIRVELKEWRTVDFNQEQLFNRLKEFKICDNVPELRFLLYGPVGAGKSSTINTIRTIFEGRQFVNCLAAALSEKSHTKYFDRFEAPKENGPFPFAFYDTMGLQSKEGAHTDDIISALKGHIKVGYLHNPQTPLSENSKYYLSNPSLSDKMHCLLCVIPADKFGLMGNDFLQQFKTVSTAASNMGVPQVVLMTRVDSACVMTKDNLQNIYKSKKIKENIKKCSDLLGVPVNRIFPVWNYHEETHMKEDINCLMLDALRNIAFWANDYVKRNV